MANYILNFSGAQVNEKLGQTNALATQSSDGLMSAADKRILDGLNPETIVTVTDLLTDKVHITNAKEKKIMNFIGIAEPVIEQLTRTCNLLNVDGDYEAAYINGNGVLTSSVGTDVLGPFMEIQPGQDIYYTGITNPEASTSTNFNRRLHVYDSNYNWIKQIQYTTVHGNNAPWSTHGVIPSNGAYVRVAWNQGDYNIMVTVGEPINYYPYYITPFTPTSSVVIKVSPDGTDENAELYTFNVPAAAGDLYSFVFNPITGYIQASTGHIDHYNGETLPNRWWSDRDNYAPNTTPSEDAEVVYVLDDEDMVEYQGTPIEIELFHRHNYIAVINGAISGFTYDAETLFVNHVTAEYGAKIGNAEISDLDIINWNQAYEDVNELKETKADLHQPMFTGNPTLATSPGISDSSNRIATTQHVTNKLKMLGPVESSNKASINYSVGEYLIYRGEFYKVISPIINGETLVIDSNIAVTTVAAELNLLFSQINGGNT